MNESSASYKTIFHEGNKGVLMRQKLDKLDIFCPMLGKENKYKVATIPDDKIEETDPEKWEDKTFKKALKHGKILTVKEKSEFIHRYCCGTFRPFTASVKASGKVDKSKSKIAILERPFKVGIPCGCFMIQPQEITTKDPKSDDVIGKTVFDFRIIDSCIGKKHWKVMDKNEEAQYIIESDMCCNKNMCAPSMFCPARELKILDAADEKKQVGEIIDYFPGCNFKGFFGTADNFKIIFPKGASSEMKLQLLSTTVLLDYMLFEKTEDDKGVDMGVAM
jgi:hypothetical protein